MTRGTVIRAGEVVTPSVPSRYQFATSCSIVSVHPGGPHMPKEIAELVQPDGTTTQPLTWPFES